MDLRRRALPRDLPELMDQPCSFEELQACLHDIARVNRLTFAYRPTLSWLAELCAQTPLVKPLRIVDVGCGYGDSLRRIDRWAARRGIAVELTGIDLNANAIRAAQAATQDQPIRWVHGDAYSLDPSAIDVVLSSLVTHHLEEEEIVRFLRWMEATARRGWFINDMHRTLFSYRAFSILIKLIPFHRFVRHDGLVTIRRSFVRQDWERLRGLAQLPAGTAEIREYRLARLCVSRIRQSHQR